MVIFPGAEEGLSFLDVLVPVGLIEESAHFSGS